MLTDYMTECYPISFQHEKEWHLPCPRCEYTPLTVMQSVGGHPLVWACPGCNRSFLRITPATQERYDNA